jgi:5-methylcytosine-specific restriction enzyme subunit McrC
VVQNKISVFEYGTLRLGQEYNGVEFSPEMLDSLECFHAANKTKYFKLIRNGIEFCNYVGVIQVGGIQIEVLPKLDKQAADTTVWRNNLIGMLRVVGAFKVEAPSKGMLSLKSNSILELYFDLFIAEVEYLVRTGLIKQYRRQTQNINSLKGALDFPRHLARNIIHQERFYTRSSVYDHEHIWHKIIKQTIDLIRMLSKSADLHNRIEALNLSFPELSSIKITQQTFSSLIYSRKTEAYRTAIEIARLLLLSFHPDLANGNNNVLALMFDMNLLWESFVYHCLRKQLVKNSDSYTIRAQVSKLFWSSDKMRKNLRPDMIIERNDKTMKIVLDTKWKDVSDAGPSSDDLQQLFAYSQLFGSAKNALVYPSSDDYSQHGHYETQDKVSGSVICIGLNGEFKNWQDDIYKAVASLM